MALHPSGWHNYNFPAGQFGRRNRFGYVAEMLRNSRPGILFHTRAADIINISRPEIATSGQNMSHTHYTASRIIFNSDPFSAKTCPILTVQWATWIYIPGPIIPQNTAFSARASLMLTLWWLIWPYISSQIMLNMYIFWAETYSMPFI